MTKSDASSDDAGPLPNDPHGHFVSIGLPDDLTARLAGPRAIRSITPDAIADAGLHRLDNAEIGCLLMGPTLDALDIIAALLAAGFRGSVTVIAPPLPNPRMVEQELKSAATPLPVRLLMR